MKKTILMLSIVLAFFLAGCATVPRMDKAPASLGEMQKSFRGDAGVMWKDADMLLIDVPLNRELVKTILPCGLWPANPATGTLVLANYPVFPYGEPYHEAILMIHVRSILGEGWHCAWILVDSDTALIPGRELLGFPKKMGKFSYTRSKTGLNASLTRRGVKLMSVSARRGKPQVKPEPVLGRKIFNVGGPGQMVMFSPLLLFKVNENIHESYEAAVELKMNKSVYDPIAELISGPPVRARMVKLDLDDSAYYFMLWWTGGKDWYLNTFNMRYR
jgi:acetoacetate decarboxylase